MLNHKFLSLKYYIVGFFVIVICCFLVCSCQTKNDLKILGEKTDNSVSLNIINQTQKNIQSFDITTSNNTSNKLLNDGDIFYSEEERVLNYTLAEETEATNESGAVIPVEYIVNVVYEDNTSFSIHGFPFKDTNQVVLKLKDNISYLEYFSNQNDKNVSTYDSEKLILDKAAQDAAAAAEAEAKAKAKVNSTKKKNNNVGTSSSSDDSGCIGGGGLYN